jgi:hypothetical protein
LGGSCAPSIGAHAPRGSALEQATRVELAWAAPSTGVPPIIAYSPTSVGSNVLVLRCSSSIWHAIDVSTSMGIRISAELLYPSTWAGAFASRTSSFRNADEWRTWPVEA